MIRTRPAGRERKVQGFPVGSVPNNALPIGGWHARRRLNCGRTFVVHQTSSRPYTLRFSSDTPRRRTVQPRTCARTPGGADTCGPRLTFSRSAGDGGTPGQGGRRPATPREHSPAPAGTTPGMTVDGYRARQPTCRIIVPGRHHDRVFRTHRVETTEPVPGSTRLRPSPLPMFRGRLLTQQVPPNATCSGWPGLLLCPCGVPSFEFHSMLRTEVS